MIHFLGMGGRGRGYGSANALGDGVVDHLVERLEAEVVEHFLDVLVVGADVAVDELGLERGRRGVPGRRGRRGERC